MEENANPEIAQMYAAVTADGRAALRGMFALLTNLGHNGLLTADTIGKIFDFMVDPRDDGENADLLREHVARRREEALAVTAASPPWSVAQTA